MICKDNVKFIALPFVTEREQMITYKIINKYGLWGYAWRKTHAVMEETIFMEVAINVSKNEGIWKQIVEEIRDIPDYFAWI